MDNIILYESNDGEYFFNSFTPLEYVSAIVGIEKNDICITSFKNSLKSTDTEFTTIPAVIEPGFDTYEYFLFQKIYNLDECSLKILNTVYSIATINLIWKSIKELIPTTVDPSEKILFVNGNYTFVFGNQSCEIKSDILETDYKTKYLSGLSSNLGISSRELNNMLRIQNITNNSIIPSDTKITINNSGALSYYIPSDSVKLEMISVAKNIFLTLSPLFVFLFSISLNIIEIDEKYIEEVVFNKAVVFERELTKMLNEIEINTTYNDIVVPIFMETFLGNNAWTFDENIILKMYTDIIFRLIVYYSVSITRDCVYYIYDLKTIPMPDGYTKTSSIVYPINIYNTTLYIKNTTSLKNTPELKTNKEERVNYNYINSVGIGNFIIVIIIIIIIIVAFIYYFYKGK